MLQRLIFFSLYSLLSAPGNDHPYNHHHNHHQNCKKKAQHNKGAAKALFTRQCPFALLPVPSTLMPPLACTSGLEISAEVLRKRRRGLRCSRPRWKVSPSSSRKAQVHCCLVSSFIFVCGGTCLSLFVCLSVCLSLSVSVCCLNVCGVCFCMCMYICMCVTPLNTFVHFIKCNK